MNGPIVTLAGVALVSAMALLSACRSESDMEWPDGFAAAHDLGRGVNLGNALEAPNEGDWGVTLSDELFDAVAEAGFDSVRVPTKWSAHALAEPPYTMDEEFFERVDWVLDQAEARDLTVVLNVHHYDELVADPAEQSERYADRPPTVYFELLNEPNGPLDPESWNALASETLGVVRASNPERTVVVGPGYWNHAAFLPQLELPIDDRHIIATFHYYEPFQFTHQGAEWAPGSEPWLGTTWMGSEEEREKIDADFGFVAEWSEKQERPVLLGDFGAYEKADLDSRARWTEAVARTAEKHGFSWAYWEFAAGFGIWDADTGDWNEPLRSALLEP